MPGLSALRIDLKRANSDEYESVEIYEGDAMRAIDVKIANDQALETEIDGLGPGLNLVRFSAQTKLGDRWITNTIALISQ